MVLETLPPQTVLISSAAYKSNNEKTCFRFHSRDFPRGPRTNSGSWEVILHLDGRRQQECPSYAASVKIYEKDNEGTNLTECDSVFKCTLKLQMESIMAKTENHFMVNFKVCPRTAVGASRV